MATMNDTSPTPFLSGDFIDRRFSRLHYILLKKLLDFGSQIGTGVYRIHYLSTFYCQPLSLKYASWSHSIVISLFCCCMVRLWILLLLQCLPREWQLKKAMYLAEQDLSYMQKNRLPPPPARNHQRSLLQPAVTTRHRHSRRVAQCPALIKSWTHWWSA